MKLYVGQNSERGSVKKFSLDLLELPVSASLPKRGTLRDMRAQRPELKFSLRLHPDVAQAGASHPDVERALGAVEALGADAVVITTGPRFTPTTAHRSVLEALAEKVRAGKSHVAWEPRGVWEAKEAAGIASDLGMLLVRDLTREDSPGGSVLYTRLLPFGLGARVSQTSLERLAERLEGAETAYVVVQAQGAKMTRTTLRGWLGLEDG